VDICTRIISIANKKTRPITQIFSKNGQIIWSSLRSVLRVSMAGVEVEVDVEEEEYEVKDEELVDFEGSDYGFESADELEEEEAENNNNGAEDERVVSAGREKEKEEEKGGGDVDVVEAAVARQEKEGVESGEIEEENDEEVGNKKGSVVVEVSRQRRAKVRKADLEDGELDDAAMVMIILASSCFSSHCRIPLFSHFSQQLGFHHQDRVSVQLPIWSAADCQLEFSRCLQTDLDPLFAYCFYSYCLIQLISHISGQETKQTLLVVSLHCPVLSFFISSSVSKNNSSLGFSSRPLCLSAAAL